MAVGTGEPVRSHLLTNLLVFGRLLRSLGAHMHTGRLLDVASGLQLVDIGNRDDVYHTCRALLVHRHEDLDLFDRAFDAFWRLQGRAVDRRETAAGATGSGNGGPPDEGHASRPPVMPVTIDAGDPGQPCRELGAWSHAGALAHKDFAELTPEEMRVAGVALARLVWSPGERRTRRWVAGRGPRLDLRRALARSPRTGGDLAILPRRRRRTRPRPIVLLCDVSGSMERYSRMLLHFAHALTRRHGRVEVFLFSTRLTRITNQIRAGTVDRALAAVSRTVSDWSGGTRTGEALRQLHQQWSRRVLHGGPVALVISDGWDRGDPAELRDQIARLQRSCHRLIWLNPLIGTAEYAPLTRGLQAALPFVDDFLAARTLADLTDLAEHLNTLAARGRATR